MEVIAVKGEELATAVAERTTNLVVGIAKAYKAGAKHMAFALFEVLGEYIRCDEDEGAPMLPKLPWPGVAKAMKLVFEKEGTDFDEFWNERNEITKNEMALIDESEGRVEKPKRVVRRRK